MSMVTYARLIRDMKSGKLLPDDDIEKLEKENKARIAQLEEQRKQLTRPEDIAKRESVSAEMVRLREELQQTLFRRANPCTVVEFDNKDVLSQLFARRLTEDAGTEFLAKGKTRLWVTKAEGLPIKIETTDNDGHVVIFFCFTDLKINAGLRAGELGLNAPPYTRMISVTADLKLKDWQERMDRDLSQQFARADKERRPQPGTGARPRPRK
jgi:hypothetical protein